MKKIRINIICFLSLAVLIAIDQFSKYFAKIKLEGHDAVTVIKHIIEFVYVENRGAAWGILSGKMIFFYIITTLLIIAIIYVFVKMPTDKKYVPLRVCLIFLTAGAVGNLIDRVVFGFVKDFINFAFVDFPVFNVADSYITISIVVLALVIIFKYKDGDFAFLKISRKKNEQ